MNSKELEFMLMNLKPYASMDELWQDVKSLQEKQLRLNKYKIIYNYYWITINPKPEITMEKFFQIINKITNLKIFRKCIFSFEQRGETEQTIGSGLHCHILGCAGNGYSHSHFCSRIRNYFTEFVGNISTHVWIVKIPEDWIEEKVQYIRGLKWDPEKEQKINMDRIWRMEKGIHPYYTKCWDLSTS